MAGTSLAATRRAMLKGATFAVNGLACSMFAGTGTAIAAGGAHASRDRESLVAGTGIAAVQTQYGKIAGYRAHDIFAFKGVPYGDTTGGANRFLPPRPPKPWTGVRSARSYGLVAPQDKGTGRLHDDEAFLFQWNDSVEGEDCLRVNIWTPGIADNARRPVMVWLHGGGFAAGSGNDLPAFDGHNLARRGDVVVVTLNHRLNLLGFLDLAAHGSAYARSGNVGMLDIVAALAWVRDNIANFGGDPDRVTIFGQSGGGAKVSTLMGMPAAKGLFHRAIVQSGSVVLRNTPERSRRLTELTLRELGIGGNPIERLQAMPYADLVRASDAVMQRENKPMGPVFDMRRMVGNLGFGPVLDGDVLPTAPFGPDAPEMTADVPMIIGTTLNEFATAINHPEYEAMTMDDLRGRLAAMFPDRADAVLAAFRQRTPQASPFDLWSRIASAPMRRGAIDQAASKAVQRRAPAYLYWFQWQTNVLDGRPRAFHCAEIPFVFANAERCDHMTGGGPRAAALEASIADAWIAFARTGNPNHAGLPVWRPYEATTQATMLFDDRCRLVLGIDREEQASVT
ncbi:MAG: carboxylesterase [Sphingomonas sp. 28-66-16]|nr:MAG: carboxylesterase [Sphingomonas sp. 28-66-16]